MPRKQLGPRQANKRGNEAFDRAEEPTVEFVGGADVSDHDVGQDGIDRKGIGFHEDFELPRHAGPLKDNG